MIATLVVAIILFSWGTTMKVLVHNYQQEETFDEFEQDIVNVDYDDVDCMTLYTERKDDKLVYFILSKEEIEMIVKSYQNGPLK